MAKITLWGMETFLKNQEPSESVFDSLVLPTGINKDDVVNNIFLRAGEFEVLYAEPEFLKEAIGLWGRKHYRTFQKWYEALQITYNPLENYDRQESWTDTHSESGSATRTDNLTQTDSSTASSVDEQSGTQTSTTSGTQNIVNQVSAFDSSDFSNKDKNDTTNSATGNTTNSNNSEISSTSNGTTTNTGTVGNIDSRSGEGEHSGRIHGNVGVTTSQQMLQSELDISKWNLVEQITDLYVSEFCIPIY